MSSRVCTSSKFRRRGKRAWLWVFDDLTIKEVRHDNLIFKLLKFLFWRKSSTIAQYWNPCTEVLYRNLLQRALAPRSWDFVRRCCARCLKRPWYRDFVSTPRGLFDTDLRLALDPEAVTPCDPKRYVVSRSSSIFPDVERSYKTSKQLPKWALKILELSAQQRRPPSWYRDMGAIFNHQTKNFLSPNKRIG